MALDVEVHAPCQAITLVGFATHSVNPFDGPRARRERVLLISGENQFLKDMYHPTPIDGFFTTFSISYS